MGEGSAHPRLAFLYHCLAARPGLESSWPPLVSGPSSCTPTTAGLQIPPAKAVWVSALGPHDSSRREDGAVEPHLRGSAFSGFLTPSGIGIGCGPRPALRALSPLLDLGTPVSAALEFLCQPRPPLWGDFSHSARLCADASRSLSWGPLGTLNSAPHPITST